MSEELANSLQHTPVMIVSSSSSDMELECSARPDSICSTYLSIIHEFIDHDVSPSHCIAVFSLIGLKSAGLGLRASTSDLSRGCETRAALRDLFDSPVDG